LDIGCGLFFVFIVTATLGDVAMAALQPTYLLAAIRCPTFQPENLPVTSAPVTSTIGLAIRSAVVRPSPAEHQN
jgi:hypothetical protein